MSDSVSRWDEVGVEEISTNVFDSKIKELFDARKAVEDAKDVVKGFQEKLDQTEAELLDLLKRAKKTKYQAEGIGTVSTRLDHSIRTPKTVEEKTLLFNWIRDKYGPDGLLGLTSINSQTLNKFVNDQKERDPLVVIPGLQEPIATETIVFRKEKK